MDSDIVAEPIIVMAEPIVAEPKQEQEPQTEKQPPYHVVLYDDQDHTHEYVTLMVIKLFSKSAKAAFEIAETVHRKGRAICLTTTREHAELKVEQIHGFGADSFVTKCSGSMAAAAEPAY